MSPFKGCVELGLSGLIPTVCQRTQAIGFAAWWFDGSISAARAEYVRRGKAKHGFDQQVASIESSRGQIDAVFSPNIVCTLSATGVHMSPEAIFARIANVSGRGDTEKPNGQ